MRAGHMRNVAKVYAPTTVSDNTGQETYTYSLYRTIYVGLVRDRYSKDESGMVQASGHEEYQLTTRFDSTITYNHHVEFNGVMHRITEIDNFMNLNHEMRIRITAVGQ